MAELKFGVTTPASDSPRERFRRHLRAAGSDFTQLREHLTRAVPQMEADQEARLAIEEIVSHLGGLLGFTTSRDEAEAIDVWGSPSGVSLVVRVVGAQEITSRLPSLVQARDRRLAATGDSARRTSALGVVCGSRVDWRRVDDTLSVRRPLDRVRLVSADSLLALAALRADHVVGHPDALVILRPQDARADPLIDLLARRGNGRDRETAAPPGEGAWWIR